MYRLITNSELENAERFEKWVFDEVLPQIRKTGTYMTELKGQEKMFQLMRNEINEMVSLKIKEIEEKWDNMGPADVCFIISKNDKYYVLAYLDAYEYYPFYFKKTPVEDILPADEEDEQYLCDELKPKVLQVLTNYATIELRGNKYKIPRYEYLKELKAK